MLLSFLPDARSGERDEWVGVRPRVRPPDGDEPSVSQSLQSVSDSE